MKNLCLLLIFSISNILLAQDITITKSKGKVWQKAESENFIFHFQPKHESKAVNLLQQANESFQKNSDLLGLLPAEKIVVFVEENQPKKKSNDVIIVLNNADHQQKMNYDINLQLLKEMMGRKSFKKLPDWLISGAAAFASNYQINEALATEHSFDNLQTLTGKEATATGIKIWHYIVQNYGEKAISDLLNLSRILANVEKGISRHWGISYQEFLQNLTRYYETQS